ncbi:hypothetical protein BGZ94_009524, partial [Podila epigama]
MATSTPGHDPGGLKPLQPRSFSPSTRGSYSQALRLQAPRNRFIPLLNKNIDTLTSPLPSFSPSAVHFVFHKPFLPEHVIIETVKKVGPIYGIARINNFRDMDKHVYETRYLDEEHNEIARRGLNFGTEQQPRIEGGLRPRPASSANAIKINIKGIPTVASREEIATNLTNHFSQHGKITTMGIYVSYRDQVFTGAGMVILEVDKTNEGLLPLSHQAKAFGQHVLPIYLWYDKAHDTCTLCAMSGHLANRCPTKANFFCTLCMERGHELSTCAVHKMREEERILLEQLNHETSISQEEEQHNHNKNNKSTNMSTKKTNNNPHTRQQDREMADNEVAIATQSAKEVGATKKEQMMMDEDEEEGAAEMEEDDEVEEVEEVEEDGSEEEVSESDERKLATWAEGVEMEEANRAQQPRTTTNGLT